VSRAATAEFPWLEPDDHYEFPDRETADADGIVGVGGNLSPGMLLSAYRQGVFPWFNPEDPIIWWSPDPRFVIFVDEVHVSRSMDRLLRQGRFRITLDTAFASVIHACAVTPRRGQAGTWITEDMELGYRRLHELGFAHSCEVWDGEQLVGGIYGVAIGKMFFAESMYSHVDNASKSALITLSRFLGQHRFDIIDSQLHTPHVERMGGRLIPRSEFLQIVDERIHQPGLPGSWIGLLQAAAST
jgi:leucyl/phenylalanyl-tRNA---protein transferase